jgi:hypothetical protein
VKFTSEPFPLNKPKFIILCRCSNGRGRDSGRVAARAVISRDLEAIVTTRKRALCLFCLICNAEHSILFEMCYFPDSVHY